MITRLLFYIGIVILFQSCQESREKHINRLVKEKDATWLCLSVTKGGHPHHPTRLAYN